MRVCLYMNQVCELPGVKLDGAYYGMVEEEIAY